jgi:hypothetical protein
MRTLEVGDYVCDCRFEHLKIAEIEECWVVNGDSILNRLPDWVPDIVWHTAHDIREYVLRKIGILTLVDKDLVLEDGQHCSAMHCCDPIEHGWKHDEQTN